jgi:hypothetical protein
MGKITLLDTLQNRVSFCLPKLRPSMWRFSLPPLNPDLDLKLW